MNVYPSAAIRSDDFHFHCLQPDRTDETVFSSGSTAFDHMPINLWVVEIIDEMVIDAKHESKLSNLKTPHLAFDFLTFNWKSRYMLQT
jgi:hypothetical protein